VPPTVVLTAASPQKQKSRPVVWGGSCFALALAWMLVCANPGRCRPTRLRLLHNDMEQDDYGQDE